MRTFLWHLHTISADNRLLALLLKLLLNNRIDILRPKLAFHRRIHIIRSSGIAGDYCSFDEITAQRFD